MNPEFPNEKMNFTTEKQQVNVSTVDTILYCSECDCFHIRIRVQGVYSARLIRRRILKNGVE